MFCHVFSCVLFVFRHMWFVALYFAIWFCLLFLSYIFSSLCFVVWRMFCHMWFVVLCFVICVLLCFVISLFFVVFCLFFAVCCFFVFCRVSSWFNVLCLFCCFLWSWIKDHTSTYEYIWVTDEYIRVTAEYIRVTNEYIQTHSVIYGLHTNTQEQHIMARGWWIWNVPFFISFFT